MYEYHNYQWSDYNNADGRQVASMKSKVDKIVKSSYDVPSYMEEFTLFSNEEAWDQALAYLNKAGIHWTTWTYKTAKENGNWSLYHIADTITPINFETASEDEIFSFFENIRESLPNSDLIDVISKHMRN